MDTLAQEIVDTIEARYKDISVNDEMPRDDKAMRLSELDIILRRIDTLSPVAECEACGTSS